MFDDIEFYQHWISQYKAGEKALQYTRDLYEQYQSNSLNPFLKESFSLEIAAMTLFIPWDNNEQEEYIIVYVKIKCNSDRIYPVNKTATYPINIGVGKIFFDLFGNIQTGELEIY